MEKLEKPKIAETVTINLDTYNDLKQTVTDAISDRVKISEELEHANTINKILLGLITAIRLYQNGASAVDHIRVFLDNAKRRGWDIKLDKPEVEIYKIK